MLDTLDARLSQARAGQFGHLEFLAMFCEDEVARRDATAVDRRLKAAHFETTANLEDYNFSFNPKVPTAAICDLATVRFVDGGESVIFHGPVGVGKTMIAQALGHAACRRGYTVAFTKTSRLLADLADRIGSTRLRRWGRPTSSSSTTSPWAPSPPPKPTTSTRLSPKEQGAASSSPPTGRPPTGTRCSPTPVAESIPDRLVNGAHRFAMEGRSYRPNKRPGRTAPEAPS